VATTTETLSRLLKRSSDNVNVVLLHKNGSQGILRSQVRRMKIPRTTLPPDILHRLVALSRVDRLNKVEKTGERLDVHVQRRKFKFKKGRSGLRMQFLAKKFRKERGWDKG
jgi:hypothetical protein